MLLKTTNYFGPQVAIIAHCTKHLLQSAQPDDGHLRAEICSCC